MALRFMEMLQLDSSSTPISIHGQEQTMGDFLAEHRDDPRYLMTWKFLTAIIEEERIASSRAIESGHVASSHSRELEATQKATQELVTKFWEAMTCNIEGVIDLGMEQKIKLLLNLLGQVKNKSTDDKTMVKIPNLGSMMDFVDGEILKDPSSFNYWAQEIVNSEYKSARLDSHIEEVFADMESHQEVLESAFEVAGAMNYPAEKREMLVQQILDEAKNKSIEEDEGSDDEGILAPEIKIQKIILQHLLKLVTQTLSEELKEQILDIYVENLKSKQSDIQISSKINMVKVVVIMDSVDQLSSKIEEKLLLDRSEYIRCAGVQALVEFVKAGVQTPVELVLAELPKLLSDSDRDVRSVGAQALVECAKVRPSEVLAEVTKLLFADDWQVRKAGADALGKCAQAGIAIPSEVVVEVAKLLFADDWQVRKAGADALGECAQAGIAIPSEVLAEVTKLLSDSDSGVRKAGANALGEFAKVSLSEVLAEVVKLLPDSDSGVRKAGAEMLGKCAQAGIAIPSEVVAEVAKLLSDSDSNVRSAGAWTLGECAQAGTAIPSEVVAEVAKLLSDSDSGVRYAGAWTLGECAQAGIAIPSEVVAEVAKLLFADDWQVRKAGAKMLGKCAQAGIAIPSEVVAEVEKLLFADDWQVRKAGAKMLGKCAQAGIAIPSEVVVEVAKLLTDDHWSVRYAGAEILGEFVKGGIAIPSEVLAEVVKLLSDDNWQVRKAGANMLGEFAKVSLSEVLAEVVKLLSDSDSGVRKAGAEVLGEFAQAGIAIPSAVVAEVAKLLTDDEWQVRYAGAEALGEFVKGGIAIPSAVVAEVVKLLTDSDSGVRYAGAEALGEFMKGGIAIPSAVVAEVRKLLSDSESFSDESIDAEYRSFLLSARENFLEGFANALKYLDQANLKGKAVVILALAESFEDFSSSEAISNIGKIAKACSLLQHKKHITEVYELLSATIVMKNDDDSDYEKQVFRFKALEKLATTALPEVLMNNLSDINDREEFVEFMTFISEHFNLLLNNETREFFKIVYARVLEFEQNSLQQVGVGEDEGVEEIKDAETKAVDDTDTEALEFEQNSLQQAGVGEYEGVEEVKDEEKVVDAADTEALEVAAVMVDTHELSKSLILKFLEAGFTTSFNLPKCEIIVGGRHYKITTDRDELEELCEKAVSAASDSGNPLARQIVEHQPLFGNSGSSVKPAASDVQHSVGILSGDELDYSSYDVSMCVRSNHNQDLQGSFILLEQRLVTGEYVYRKIYAENGGVKVASQAVNPIDMENSGTAVRKAIFGEMSYYGASGSADAGGDVERPVYYTKTLRVRNEDAVISMYEALRDSAVSEEAADIFALFSGRVALGDDVAVISWEEFTKEGNSSNRNKAEILKLEGDALDQFKSDEACFAGHVKLDNLDTKFRETILKDAEILQQVIEDHKFAEAEKAEIASISANPYQDAFYKALRMELNSAYLAAKSIDSGWIKSNKQGDMGKFGSFLQKVSGVVPIVGPGVNMLGTILTMADEKKQSGMIKNVAEFFVDSGEMSKFAEKLARSVVLNKDLNVSVQSEESLLKKLKGYFFGKAAGVLSETAKDAAIDGVTSDIPKTIPGSIDDVGNSLFNIGNAMLFELPNMLQQNLQEAVDEAYEDAENDLMEAASDRLAGVKADQDAVAAGKAAGAKIAKLIIARISVEELAPGNIEHKVEEVVAFVTEKFAEQEVVQDESKTDLDVQGISESEATKQNVEDITIHPNVPPPPSTPFVSTDKLTGTNTVFAGGCACVVSHEETMYGNVILQDHSNWISFVAKNHGVEASSKLIDLGTELDVVEAIFSEIQTHGADQVFGILFGDCQVDPAAE